MVREISKNNKKYYQCEECKFFYGTKSLARKCENWCEKYKSCNLEITKNSVKI